MEEFVDMWLSANELNPETSEYGKYADAVDYLYDLAYSNPRLLIIHVDAILSCSRTKKTLGALGAGPIEEAFVYHQEYFLKLIESAIDSGSDISLCLHFVHLDHKETSKEILDFKLKYKHDNASGDS